MISLLAAVPGILPFRAASSSQASRLRPVGHPLFDDRPAPLPPPPPRWTPEDDGEPILTQREQRVLRALRGYPKDQGFNAAGIPWLTELRDHSGITDLRGWSGDRLWGLA